MCQKRFRQSGTKPDHVLYSATNYKWQSLCHSGSLEGQDPCHPCILFLGSHLVPPRLHMLWSNGNTLAYRSDHVEMLKLGIEAA